MIPKVIHYCWFSGDPKPRSIVKCMNSWKKYLPDYEIKCWDGNSFDFDSITFTKEAMKVKQYASAADYVRLYALYHEGGIYLDSDIMVRKSFDDFLDNDFFSGTETYNESGIIKYRVEAGIIGSEKNNPLVLDAMHYFENNPFIREDGSWDNRHIVLPDILGISAEKFGYSYEDKDQDLVCNMKIFSSNTFVNWMFLDDVDVDKLYAIHQHAGSWIDYSYRGKLFHFCGKHDLMLYYYSLEKNLKKIRKLF